MREANLIEKEKVRKASVSDKVRNIYLLKF